MYRKEKSSWKPPFGLLVFVLITTLTALFFVFAFIRVEEDYISWVNTVLSLTYDGKTYYNYAPIIVAFLASFLPLLTFPIGKRMRGHQRLLAFTLFLVTAMVFFTCQCFTIYTLDGYTIGYKHYYDGIQLRHSFFTAIKLYSYNWKTGETIFNLWGYLEVIIKYLLCFLPLLAFPIANLMHKKSQGSKTLTIFIMLLFFTCWSVNLFLLNIDQYGLNWLNFTVFDADGINIGLFYFLGVGISAFLPMIMLGVRKAPEKVIEKHYIEKRIIYCPIERNDRD